MTGYEKVTVNDVNKVGDNNSHSALLNTASGEQGASETRQSIKTEVARMTRNLDLSQFPNLEISGLASKDDPGMKNLAVIGNDASLAKSPPVLTIGDGGTKELTQAADKTKDQKFDEESGEIWQRLKHQWAQHPEVGAAQLFLTGQASTLDDRLQKEGFGKSESLLVESALMEVLMSRYCSRPDEATDKNINRDMQILKEHGITENDIQTMIENARKAHVPAPCVS